MGTMEMEFYLNHTTGRVADWENAENVATAIENCFEVSFPGICLHNQSKLARNDARQECHQVHSVTGSELDSVFLTAWLRKMVWIEPLRKIRCVLELYGIFNREVEEQLHLKLDSNKNFVNMMTPVKHIC